MTDLVDMRRSALLAFWAKSMVAIKAAGMSWPGLTYTDAEWVRLEQLATAVDGEANARFKLINAAV
jgi:hypothetical protein